MKILRKVLKILGWTLVVLLLILLSLGIWIYNSSSIRPPVIADTSALQLMPVVGLNGNITIGDNWKRTNHYGMHEMYVSGKPFERGVKNGRLSRREIELQEVAFTNEIKRMVPNHSYLKFLKYLVGFANRKLPDHVAPEYQEEIFGISHAASDSFQWIGDNYTRLMNYHAAHDIGHALQNLMLVGCTSFAGWGGKTEKGELLIGRNFDFWVGDEFAKEKIILFCKPDKGYGFMSVTWGGFIGIASGMNEQGLTVTINAAKSAIPYGGAATPVSLVAREILQYAKNLDEAVAIAHSRKMFVSESFLIGSAADHKAIVIEKTPDTLAIYDPQADNILCTNHYQSGFYDNDIPNKEQKQASASVYRHQRLQELMTAAYPLTPQKMAAILRDRRGLGGKDIGEGNEKAVNQLIAHHSVIFMPDSLRVWVSTGPWQLGPYVCYDLRKIFGPQRVNYGGEIDERALEIPADSFLQMPAYTAFLRFRQNKLALLRHEAVDTAAVTRSNPNLYDAWRIAGDFCFEKKWYGPAAYYYTEALKREVATESERQTIGEKLRQARQMGAVL